MSQVQAMTWDRKSREEAQLPEGAAGQTAPRVVVVGGGAIGSVFAVRLHLGGIPVCVIDVDPGLVETVNAGGLHLHDSSGVIDAKVRFQPDVTGIGSADVVLVCVKGYHTASVADLIGPLMSLRTVVVSLQNGYGQADVLAERFGSERVVLGVTYNSATVTRTGHVRQTGVGPTVIGPYEPPEGADRLDGPVGAEDPVATTGPADRVARLLSDAGLEARADAVVRSHIWKKLVFNAATLPTAALTGLTAGELGRPGPMLDLVDEVCREAVSVANAYGFDIDADERLNLIHSVLPKVGDGKASMLQDREAGRRTEIDYINGAVVRGGAQLGVPVPLNQALYALVKAGDTAGGTGRGE